MELKYADSDEPRKKPLVIVKHTGTPYAKPKGDRKVIQVELPVRASDNLLRRCFRKPDGMRDIVTRERMVFRMTDAFRLGIAKEWLQNLKLTTDTKPLKADATQGRRDEHRYHELFPDKAASIPPTDLFVSCGVAPDLLQEWMTGPTDSLYLSTQGTMLAAVLKETKREGKWDHRVLAVPCMWMKLEFEELMMHPKVREDIHKEFYQHVTSQQLTENETWHCAIEQVNAARVLVANHSAYLLRLRAKSD